MQQKSHPHIVKAVINDNQRRIVLDNLRWKFNKVAERRKELRVIQDRLDHIYMLQSTGKSTRILVEYTILIVSLTFNWEKVYGLRANRYTTLDFSNIVDEFDRIKKILASLTEHPPVNPIKNVVLQHFECKDWVIV